MEGDQASAAPTAGSRSGGEPRWPMAGAVVAAIVLTLLLPDDLRLGPNWALPVLEAVLLVVIVVGDPGSIDRQVPGVACGWDRPRGGARSQRDGGTGFLIDSLVTGGPETDSASELLGAGAIVWISNNIAFALLYWELDSGGAAARAQGLRPYPDLAFPQQLSPHIVAPGWRPRFIDYLYLGFTNATALSPTDAMPLAPWAKIAMTIQSLVSLALLALVIARAVNVLD